MPEINPDDYKDKDWIRYRLPEIKSTIHARNYWKNGMNRAGTVLDFNYKRTEPCTSMDKGVYIEYDGSMTACCDMIAPELHSEWTVGNLKEEPDLSVSTIDGTRYYKTPTGKMYPSITSVTSFYNRDVFINWRKKVGDEQANKITRESTFRGCLLYTSPSPRDVEESRMPSSA